MTLSELPLHTSAVVESVQDLHANDAIARRLRELGFVNGEEVRLVAKGPVGGGLFRVQVGSARLVLGLRKANRFWLDANRQERRA